MNSLGGILSGRVCGSKSSRKFLAASHPSPQIFPLPPEREKEGEAWGGAWGGVRAFHLRRLRNCSTSPGTIVVERDLRKCRLRSTAERKARRPCF